MINKLSAIGKRWQKNSMDRIYIYKEVVEMVEVDDIITRNYYNRRDWSNLKIFYDVKAKDFVVTTGSQEAKEAVVKAIESLIK